MPLSTLMRRYRHQILPLFLLIALVSGSIVFRHELRAWFTGQPLGTRRAPMTVTQAGTLQLALQVQPDPPQQHGNVVHLQVQDATGAPVDAEEVSIVYSMPAMGSMPEMRGTAEVSKEASGRYRADFDLPMGGTWTLETTATTPQGTQTARHTFTVGSPGLRPVGGTAASASPDGVVIDAQRRQQIGIRTAPLTKKPLHLSISALGRVTYDESRFTDVTLKLRGWVVTLYANTTGQYVRQGDTLLTLYSPELYAAQQEYLLALRSQAAAQRTGAPDRADYLVQAARQRLRLLDITAEQLQDIAQRGEPIEHMPILAPASGYVVEKHIVAGAALEPGQRLYRLAALDRVWIEAEVYEADLPRVKVGQQAQVTLPHLPGRHYTGTITYIYPYLQENTRTGRVRLTLPNRGMELLPAMYANADIRVTLGQRLVVPEEAVVYTGRHRLVFVDLGEGRLRPQEVELGLKSDGYYEVLRGVQEGDMIVTSGNFLVASEARLRTALQQWGSENGNP
jgi:RND family efflux transporter MFP subunit